jgi:ParB-like chromosome segregation protein Spo0J
LDTTQKLTIETVPIDRLFCSPANPRRNDPAVPHVAASIRRFGFRQPIVAKPSGEVIADSHPWRPDLGHPRLHVLSS